MITLARLLPLDPPSARFRPASQPIERLTRSRAMLTPTSVRQAGKPLVAIAFAAALAAAPGGFLTDLNLGTGAALAARGNGGGNGGGSGGGNGGGNGAGNGGGQGGGHRNKNGRA